MAGTRSSLAALDGSSRNWGAHCTKRPWWKWTTPRGHRGISEARHAILDRAEKLLTGSPSDERGALNDALQALRVLEQAMAKESRLM
jgi:hypothetical protein